MSNDIGILVRPEMMTAVRAEQCRRSFYRFVQEFWSAIIPETPQYNWHMQLIANEMQRMAQRVKARLPKKYDLVINVPPGSSKSTIVSVMFPVWCWTIDPTMRSICGSYSGTLSQDLATKSRDITACMKYQLYFPEVKVRDDRGAPGHFKNTYGGERISTSVGGSVTGMHAHFLLIDDPLNPEEAQSDTMLQSANSWMDGTVSTRCVDKAITPLILIMQRLHEDDPTGHILEQAKKQDSNRLRHICLPAEKNELIAPKSAIKYYSADGLLDPKRMSKVVLDGFKARLGEYKYAGQFEQAPVPPEGGLFRCENFELIDLVEWNSVRRAVRYWDKAASDGKGDYTVGVLMCYMADGRYLIADVRRGRWSTGTREKLIKDTAESDGTEVDVWVEQEPGSGGKSDAEMTIRNLAGWNARKDKADTAKHLRAVPYSAQIEAHNVLLKRASWNDDFLHEHRLFPNSKHKDQVDAASGAFTQLVNGDMVGVF